MAVSGPGMHFLHQLLETLSPRVSRLSVLKKLVVDRVIVTPPYLLLFFYTVALLEVSVCVFLCVCMPVCVFCVFLCVFMCGI